MSTGIEWTDETWNPTTGCDRVSAGCDNCYALGMAKRLKAMGSKDYQTDGDPNTSGPGFGLAIHPHRLDQPLRWKKPRKVFVNSMSDLFHDQVPDDYIAQVFAVMAAAPQHTFQVLTKRHGRMRSLLSSVRFDADVIRHAQRLAAEFGVEVRVPRPLPNVWLGVSVEDQKWADIRIPALLMTPAAVRFLSMEPLLGPVGLTRIAWSAGGGTHLDVVNGRHGVPETWQAPGKHVDWVIAGGESGPGARPMHPDWALDIMNDCRQAGVPFLFKQWGNWAPVAPARARKGDVALHSDGSAMTLDPDLFTGLEFERRRQTFAMRNVGKKAAGRYLGNRTHDEYPPMTPP